MAEAIVNTASAAASANRDELTTKADLAGLEAKIADLRADLCRALWIQGGAIVAILTALRFLPV